MIQSLLSLNPSGDWSHFENDSVPVGWFAVFLSDIGPQLGQNSGLSIKHRSIQSWQKTCPHLSSCFGLFIAFLQIRQFPTSSDLHLMFFSKMLSPSELWSWSLVKKWFYMHHWKILENLFHLLYSSEQDKCVVEMTSLFL